MPIVLLVFSFHLCTDDSPVRPLCWLWRMMRNAGTASMVDQLETLSTLCSFIASCKSRSSRLHMDNIFL